MNEDVILRNLSDAELLRYVDRANLQVKELAARFDVALCEIAALEEQIADLTLTPEDFQLCRG